MNAGSKRKTSPEALGSWFAAIVCTIACAFLPRIASMMSESVFVWVSTSAHQQDLDDPIWQSQSGVAELTVAVGVYLSVRLILGLLAIRFAIIGREAQTDLDTQIMQQRSLEARNELIEAVRDGKSPPSFFLYLRPFYSDELFVSNPDVSSLPFLPSHYSAPSVSWESVFAKRVEAFGRLVSLGRTSDTLGADRIETSDGVWTSEFVLLASLADRIFVWPSTRPGTRWEIKWLLEQKLLPKCVFVVASGYDNFTGASETWDYVRAFLLTLGLSPPLLPGVLFAPATPALRRPLRISFRQSSRRAIRDLLSATHSVESAADRVNRWRFAEAALAATPPELEDELDIVLPCVQCGGALSEIVCVACDPEWETVWQEEKSLTPCSIPGDGEHVQPLSPASARAWPAP
jgi:hypothetical protein